MPAVYQSVSAIAGSAASYVMPLPLGSAAGDLVCVVLGLRLTTAQTFTGATLALQSGPGGGQSTCYQLWFRVTAADVTAGTHTIGWTTSTRYCIAGYRVTGALATGDPVHAVQAYPGSTTNGAYSVLETDGGLIVGAVTAHINTTYTWTAAMTERNDTQTGASGSGGMTTAGATHAATTNVQSEQLAWLNGAGSTHNYGLVCYKPAPAAPTTTPVSTSRATTWRALERRTTDRSSTWNVAEQAAVLTPVATTRATTWHVRQQLADPHPTSWRVLQQVTDPHPTTWQVRRQEAAARAATWSVRRQELTARGSSWQVLRPVEVAAATSWAVVGTSTPVATSRGTSWEVRAGVAVGRAATWQVSAGVTAPRSTSWAVRAPVTAARGTGWSVRRREAAARAAAWQVRALATGSRATSWEVREQQATTRAATWDVLVPVAQPRSTTWSVQGLAKAHTLVDAFDTQSALWSGWRAEVRVAGGQLLIDRTFDYYGLLSVDRYDLTGSSVTVDVPEVLPRTSSRIDTELHVRAAGADLMALVEGGTMYLGWQNGAGTRFWTTAAYDPVLHRYWRIAETAGEVVWSTSSDGEVWAEGRRENIGLPLMSVQVALQAGVWDTVPVPGTGAFAGVNVTGTTQVSTSRSTSWEVRSSAATSNATSWTLCGALTTARTSSWQVRQQVAGARATSWQVRASRTAARATTWAVRPQPDRYALQVLADNPRAYWRLSDPDHTQGVQQGMMLDERGTHHGFYEGVSETVPGLVGTDDTARAFTGDDNGRVDSPQADDLALDSTMAFTIEFVANSAPGMDGYPSILRWGEPWNRGWLVYTHPPSQNLILKATGIELGVQSAAVIPGEAHHYAITHDGAGTIRFYRDGAELLALPAVGEWNVGVKPPAQPLLLAAGDQRWLGTLDEVALYWTELSPARILAHAQARSDAPVVTQVATSRSASWSTLAGTSTARGTSWEARATAAAVRPTSWSVRTALTTARASNWQVRAGLSTARPASWEVRASRTAARATTWAVRQQLTSSRSSTWAALAGQSTVRSTSWATLQRQAAARGSGWQVLALVAGGRSTTWAAQGRLEVARSTTWQVEGLLTPVATSRGTSWSVVQQAVPVAASRTASWAVRQRMTVTRASAWEVRALAVVNRSAVWTVLQQQASARAASWSVRSSRSTARSSSWQVRQQATTARASSWQVRQQLTAVRPATWRVLRAAVTARSSTWQVRQQLQLSRSSSWSLTGRVTAARSTSWQVEYGSGSGIVLRTGTAQLVVAPVGRCRLLTPAARAVRLEPAGAAAAAAVPPVAGAGVRATRASAALLPSLTGATAPAAAPAGAAGEVLPVPAGARPAAALTGRST